MTRQPQKSRAPGATPAFTRRDFLAKAAAFGFSVPFASSLLSTTSMAAHHGDIAAVLETAVAQNDMPFVVAMAGNAAGTTWSGAAGDRAPGIAATEDTVFRIFSMTKAIGTTAAMQLIENGKLSVDTPVEDILPQFANMQVLEGFDGEVPKLRAPKTKATVRHLATHTSGLVYEFWNPDIAKYLAVTGHPTIISGTKVALNYPMVFDPGERWDYGIGIDWLGQIVEAVDGRRIDEYCQAEIFDPLDMPDTRFEVEGTMAERMSTVSIRGEDGLFTDFPLGPPPSPEFYGMGHALYSTAPDYMRFIRSFLNKGELDGARILGEASVAQMLTNHIGDIRVGPMVTAAPPITADVRVFPDTPKTHSFGFLRVEEDVPGMRSAGSQGWAGVCNTHFWFDPTNDVAGLIMTQTLPFVEPRFMNTYAAFERAVYAHMG